MLRVRDIMTSPVFSLDERASALDAALALTGRHIGGAPVVDSDGNTIGVLSKSDLVDPAPADWIKGEAYVADLMNPDVVVIYADDPALAAAQIMAEKGVHRLVVMDTDGKVVGIVSAMDFVRAVARGDGFGIEATSRTHDLLDAA